MEKRKTIQVNPAFFKLGKKTKSKKDKKKRMDLRQSIKPNNLKKQLLARIKNHQQEQKNKNDNDSKEKIDEFQTDFNSSLNYLQTMIKQKKEKKKKKTRKRKKKEQPSPNMATINTQPFSNENVITPQLINPPSQNSYKHAPAPPYGCLKNGSKPTYSQYMKTMKKKKKPKSTLVLPPKPPPTASVLERKEKLSKLKEKMALPKKEKILKTISKKRTIKIFKLGKKEGKVGVLVKSGKTRKKVREEQKVLHSKCILEVKRYLRKHNLIKAGTTAPENVLRKLYEDSFLAGDIYNKNPDILLHNYMEQDH